MPGEFDLVLVGAALEGNLVKPLNLRLIAGLRTHVRAFEQSLRLLHDERAVHQEQRLLRHRGTEALRARGVRAGEVKGAEEARQVLALDKSIDSAARGERFGGDVVRAPACSKIQLAGSGQQRVAHRLKVEPFAVHAPAQFVGRIDLRTLWLVFAGLLVGGGKHDELVETLD